MEMIYCWEYEYWNKDEEEWESCEYYTYSQDHTTSSTQLVEDEGWGVDYTLLEVRSVTYEEFLKWYGDGSDNLILDSPPDKE